MKQGYFSWLRASDIVSVQKLLSENKLIIGTSDTVIGLYTICSSQGYALLNKVKGRHKKPYIILIENYKFILNYSYRKYFRRYHTVLRQCWPGPVTAIFPAKKTLPYFLTGGGKTVAFRVPQHDGLLQLLKNISGVFSTSANLHGQPIPQTIAEVDSVIKKKASAIIVNHQSTVQPSTIIDCTRLDGITIVREGALSAKKIMQLDKLIH